MVDGSPRAPLHRPLLWQDAILDLQEIWLEVMPDLPLYMIGGAVRDAYWHRPCKDLDFATPYDSIKFARKLADKFKGDIFIMDEARGVARVWLSFKGQDWRMDVAQFRGEDLQADLLGRDFTLNALAVDARGDLSLLIDPFGWEADAHQRILRQCSPQSISDDPIRGLRAVRQSVEFGLRLEPSTAKAIQTHAQQLMNTSAERVRDELFALLGGTKPASALRLAQSLGLMDALFPAWKQVHQQASAAEWGASQWELSLAGVERAHQVLTAISPRRTDHTAAVFDLAMLVIQLDRYRRTLNEYLEQIYVNERSHHALLLFACLYATLPLDALEQICEQFRLSNQEKKIVLRAVEFAPQVLSIIPSTPVAVHRFWYPLEKHGIDAIVLAVAQHLALMGNYLNQQAWLVAVERIQGLCQAYFEQYEQLVAPLPWLDGNDLLALGLQGRAVGEALTFLRESQVEGKVNNREQALSLIQAWWAERR